MPHLRLILSPFSYATPPPPYRRPLSTIGKSLSAGSCPATLTTHRLPSSSFHSSGPWYYLSFCVRLTEFSNIYVFIVFNFFSSGNCYFFILIFESSLLRSLMSHSCLWIVISMSVLELVESEFFSRMFSCSLLALSVELRLLVFLEPIGMSSSDRSRKVIDDWLSIFTKEEPDSKFLPWFQFAINHKCSVYQFSYL